LFELVLSERPAKPRSSPYRSHSEAFGAKNSSDIFEFLVVAEPCIKRDRVFDNDTGYYVGRVVLAITSQHLPQISAIRSAVVWKKVAHATQQCGWRIRGGYRRAESERALGKSQPCHWADYRCYGLSITIEHKPHNNMKTDTTCHLRYQGIIGARIYNPLFAL